MRLAWYSNAPWSASGYGVQTKHLVPRIQALGHEVSVLCNFGLEGGSFVWNGIPCFPRAHPGLEGQLIVSQCQSLNVDAIITLYDAWPLHPSWLRPRWVAWYPVDREPIPTGIVNAVRMAHTRWTASRHGEQEATRAGIPSRYIPYVVDTKAFGIKDRVACRKDLNFPPDAFIVGIVADNKGNPNRKALGAQLEAVARFAQAHDDVILYLHTLLGPQRNGIDLPPLLQSLGLLPARVRVVDQNGYQMGMPEQFMVDMFNALDVLCGVSMDEGCGVPLLEAQVCGTPVIAGDWTGMPEHVRSGWLVPRTHSQPWWNPTGGYQRLPHVEGILESLELAYAGARGMSRDTIRAKVMEFDADTVVAAHWVPALAELQARIADENARPTFAKVTCGGVTA